MGKRAMFLFGVFAILLGSIFGIAWISKTFIWPGELQPAFLGALVAASGTIFAACIAYTAAIQSVEMARETAQSNAIQATKMEAQNKAFMAAQSKREFQELLRLRDYLDSLLARFKSPTSERDFLSQLSDAYNAGAIVAYGGGTISDFMPRVNEAFQRFWGMQGPTFGVLAKPANEVAETRAKMNEEIRDHLDRLRKFRDDVDAEIERRKSSTADVTKE